MLKGFVANNVKIDNIEMGKGCILEEDVEIGEGSILGHYVVIHAGAKIGARVRIDDHATIGKNPMRSVNSALKSQETFSPIRIGDDCIIGTSAILYNGCRLGNHVLVADLATVRENVSIGEATIIGRGVAVENDCSIGCRCKLETNAYIAAYSKLEDFVFVAPGVVTTNDNYAGRTKERFKHFKGITVKRGGRLGAQVTVLPGKVVGEDSLVAAGSVVTRDIEAETIAVGNPAKAVRKVPENQLLRNQNW